MGCLCYLFTSHLFEDVQQPYPQYVDPPWIHHWWVTAHYSISVCVCVWGGGGFSMSCGMTAADISMLRYSINKQYCHSFHKATMLCFLS